MPSVLKMQNLSSIGKTKLSYNHTFRLTRAALVRGLFPIRLGFGGLCDDDDDGHFLLFDAAINRWKLETRLPSEVDNIEAGSFYNEMVQIHKENGTYVIFCGGRLFGKPGKHPNYMTVYDINF